MRYSIGTLLLLMALVGVGIFSWQQQRVSREQLAEADRRIASLERHIGQHAQEVWETKLEFGRWRTWQAPMLQEAGRVQEALALYEQALEIQGQFIGSKHEETLRTVFRIAELNRQLGNDAAAETHLIRFIEHTRTAPKNNYLTLPIALSMLGSLRMEQERFSEARRLYEESYDLRKQYQPNHRWTVRAANRLGVAMVGEARFADAEPILIESFQELKDRADEFPEEYQKKSLRQSASSLVVLYEKWRKPGLAAEWRAIHEDLQEHDAERPQPDPNGANAGDGS